MSYTPRTEEAEKKYRAFDGFHNLQGMTEFSRQLERELAQAKEQLQESDKKLSNLIGDFSSAIDTAQNWKRRAESATNMVEYLKSILRNEYGRTDL